MHVLHDRRIRPPFPQSVDHTKDILIPFPSADILEDLTYRLVLLGDFI